MQTLVAVDRPASGLEEPAARSDDGARTFAELLEDPRTRDLGAREREILQARYGSDGSSQTLREIGNRLGLSAERVRQIEERALGKLRAS